MRSFRRDKHVLLLILRPRIFFHERSPTSFPELIYCAPNARYANHRYTVRLSLEPPSSHHCSVYVWLSTIDTFWFCSSYRRQHPVACLTRDDRIPYSGTHNNFSLALMIQFHGSPPYKSPSGHSSSNYLAQYRHEEYIEYNRGDNGISCNPPHNSCLSPASVTPDRISKHLITHSVHHSHRADVRTLIRVFFEKCRSRRLEKIHVICTNQINLKRTGEKEYLEPKFGREWNVYTQKVHVISVNSSPYPLNVYNRNQECARLSIDHKRETIQQK